MTGVDVIEGARIVDEAPRARYELRLGDALLGAAHYRSEPGVLVLEHVWVEPTFERLGLGSRLVEHALEDARARGLAVVPACAFAAWYVRRHPEHADLVRGA